MKPAIPASFQQRYSCYAAKRNPPFRIEGVMFRFFSTRLPPTRSMKAVPAMTATKSIVHRRGSVSNQLLPDDRLPRYPSRDDYYEFWAGRLARSSELADWTNQDQAPVGRPVLWAGTLAHQPSGEFLVLINEQDNKDWPVIKQAISLGLESIGAIASAAGAGPLVTAAIQAAQTLAHGRPENSGTGDLDDVIGAFSVRFTKAGQNPRSNRPRADDRPAS